MSFSPFRFIRRGFGFFWCILDTGRRFVLNVLFLLLALAIGVSLFLGSVKKPESRTTLVLDLKGQLVEQYPGNAGENFLSGVMEEGQKDTQLRDVLLVLEAAAKDPKISNVLLMLDDLQNAGLPALREVAAAVDRFKASGKAVTAWGASYNQKQYFVAAHATQVLLHPMGMVLLDGFGHYRNYYRDALDKLGITVNLMRVGTYKSFAEPYIANGPSPAAAEAESFLYNAMWATYTAEVENARKLPAGSVMRGIDNLPELMAAAGGDTGKLALSAKLVDGLKTRDELMQVLLPYGARDKDGKNLRQIRFEDYLSLQKPKQFGDAVGVVIAEGEISDGNARAGAVGGLSTSELIRKAREDEHIKAIVLRIDSPGGSAFGSELIRRELELARKAGKPVVVSMGNVAASGGYWIAMASDEIIADPTTITGSIGVFAILPTAEKAIDKLGIHTGGVTTTWLRDAYHPLRPLDPRFEQLIQTGIDHVYADFTTKAALARKTTPQKIDEVGQGRVWTGLQAKERGLVDTIGSYGDALKSAAARVKLGDGYRIAYIEREPSKFDRFFELFGSSAARTINRQIKEGMLAGGLAPGIAGDTLHELSWLADLANGSKPFMAVTHCLCREP